MLAVAIGKENKSERNTHGTKMKKAAEDKVEL